MEGEVGTRPGDSVAAGGAGTGDSMAAGEAGAKSMGTNGAPGEESAADPTAAPRSPFADLRARWSIPWVIGGAIVLGLVATVVTQAFGLQADDTAAALFSGSFAFYGATGLWLLWACRRHGIRLHGFFGQLPESAAERGLGSLALRVFGLLAVALAFSLGSGMVFLCLISLLAPDLLPFVLEGALQPPGEGLARWLGFPVVVVIAAPVFEEAFFRGMLVNRWGTKWSLGTAVVVSSLAFGILHVNPVGIGMVGVVMALLYIQTRNLLVPILFHAANNLFATLTFFVEDDAGPFDVAAEIQALQDEVWWGVGLMAISLPFLVRYIRRAWPKRDAAIPYRGP